MRIVPTAPKFTGASVKRREDPRLIQGLARYVDDIVLPGTLHVAILRSPYAHARIKKIDTSATRKAPGVVAVYTSADLEGKVGDIPVGGKVEGTRIPRHPVLAVERVRYVGEAVAAVVAEARYSAIDALDLIEVDYDILDAVVDSEKALAPGAPRVHEAFEDNLVFTWELKGGDVEAGLKEADVVIKQKIYNNRVAPLPLEPRGILAHYRPGEDKLTFWSSNQGPHFMRTQIAKLLDIPENRIRCIAPEVGGGFGSKFNVYREDVLLPYIARDLGRPVKWIESRSENFLTTNHGRAQTGEVEMGFKKDGTITAMRYNVVADCGAYLQFFTVGIFTLTGSVLTGPYRIRNACMHITGVFTHKMGTDAFRGAGRPEAAYILDRMMDLAAAELGMDTAALRRRNFPDKSEFPFETPGGVAYDSGDYAATLDKLLEKADYAGLRGRQAQARKDGRYLGIGLSTFIEMSGVGPSKNMPIGGWESAAVRVVPSGGVTVLTGLSPHGQGQETAFAQIAADALGVDIEDVVVVHGDTDVVQQGTGTFGSRGIAIGGAALHGALEKVRNKMAKFAALHFEADAEDIAFENSRIFVRSAPEKTIPFAKIAEMAHQADKLPPGTTPGLDEQHFFEASNFTFPFGAHLAMVEVDPQTGEVKFLRYVAVDDVGNIINPLLVAGQVHGGIAMGAGQALEEEVFYDDAGQPLNASFMHYALPKAHKFPRFELDHTVTPSPVNPLGAKGVGEAGTIGATPAVVNAVLDALAPFGIRHLDMPLRPERIWRAVRDKTLSGENA